MSANTDSHGLLRLLHPSQRKPLSTPHVALPGHRVFKLFTWPGGRTWAVSTNLKHIHCAIDLDSPLAASASREVELEKEGLYTGLYKKCMSIHEFGHFLEYF